jgi:hypothetical protein
MGTVHAAESAQIRAAAIDGFRRATSLVEV